MKVFRLIGIVIILAVFVLLVYLVKRKVSLDTARSLGVKKVGKQLKQPLLLYDYAQKYALTPEQVEAMVNRGEIEAYTWGGHTFVEDD